MLRHVAYFCNKLRDGRPFGGLLQVSLTHTRIIQFSRAYLDVVVGNKKKYCQNTLIGEVLMGGVGAWWNVEAYSISISRVPSILAYYSYISQSLASHCLLHRSILITTIHSLQSYISKNLKIPRTWHH